MNRSVYFITTLLCIGTSIFGSPVDDLASALKKVSERSITKINDNLYVGHKEDLYFGFERVTKDNIGFWQNYAEKQTELSWKRADDLVKASNTKAKSEQTPYLKAARILREQFITAIGSFSESLKYYNKAELWIAYATTQKIDTFAKNITSNGFIEMAAPMLTEQSIPFYTPMGISRAVEFYQTPLHIPATPTHKDLSLKLHSFGAEAMKLAYGNKDFFITKPMEEMAKIMQKKLPKKSYWVEDSIEPKQIQITETQPKHTMKILRKGPHTTEKEFAMPFFYQDHMHLHNALASTIMVDIDALAELMK